VNLFLILIIIVVVLLAAAGAAIGTRALVRYITQKSAFVAAKVETYRQRRTRKRVEAAPLRERMPTSDNKPTYVKVRPTVGDTLPRNVLDELEEYVAGLARKDIHGKLKVEYRNGKWESTER
jgi:Flp pilus assembly protein TadG